MLQLASQSTFFYCVSLWNNSKYESTLRELTPEEFEKYNERALKIEESDDIE